MTLSRNSDMNLCCLFRSYSLAVQYWRHNKNYCFCSSGLIIHILFNCCRVERDSGEEYRFGVLLTHRGRAMPICVSKLAIIGSDNGLSPGRRQAIIWTNAGILLIWNLGTNFSEMLSEIHTFSFKKMHVKMSSATWRQLCIGLNVLIWCSHDISRSLSPRNYYKCIQVPLQRS